MKLGGNVKSGAAWREVCEMELEGKCEKWSWREVCEMELEGKFEKWSWR